MAAADRARSAGRLHLLEVPRTRLEAVRCRGQRPYRADLDGVAREVRVERLRRERRDLDQVATSGHVDLGVAGDLVGEPRAARALDAAFTIEFDEVADLDRLGPVTLLLYEPALPWTVRERLVLERALPTLVADRAVQRVVDEQKLEYALLGFSGLVGVREHLEAVSDLQEARRLQAKSPGSGDLDEAHPAHTDRLHTGVVAKPRDEDSLALGRGDDQLTWMCLDRRPIDGDRDHLLGSLGGPGANVGHQ